MSQYLCGICGQMHSVTDDPCVPASPGLGDRVAQVAHAFGFEQTPGCGCAERQAALNKVSLRHDGPVGAVIHVYRALRGQ